MTCVGGRTPEEAKKGDNFLNWCKADKRKIFFSPYAILLPYTHSILISVLTFYFISVDDWSAFTVDFPFWSWNEVGRGWKSLKKGTLPPGWLVATLWQHMRFIPDAWPACRPHATWPVLVSSGTETGVGTALFSIEEFSYRFPPWAPILFLLSNNMKFTIWIFVKDICKY